MDQQKLIDQAHHLREKDGFSSETLTFALEPLTDEGVNLLLKQRPDLKGLFLMRTRVTDSCIDILRQFPNLKEVNVSQTKITANGIAKLVEFVPMTEWTFDAIQFDLTVAQALSNQSWIRSVQVWGYPKNAARHEKAYDPHCLALANSKTLKSIVFRSLPFNGTCIEAVSNMALSEFGITGSACPLIPMYALADCSSLISLNLSGTYADDDLLDVLLGKLHLETLYMSHTNITDRTVEKVLSTQKLKALSIEMCNVSEEAIMRLTSMKTLEYIEFWNDHLRDGLPADFYNTFGSDIHID